MDVARLGDSRLSPVVEEIWSTAYSGYETRELFLHLIRLTPLPACVTPFIRRSFRHQLANLSSGLRLSWSTCGRYCRTEAQVGSDTVERTVAYKVSLFNHPGTVLPDGLRTDEIVTTREENRGNPKYRTRVGFCTVFAHSSMKMLGLKKCAHSGRLFPQEVWENRKRRLQHCMKCHSEYDHLTNAILAGCARDTDIVSAEDISDWAWSAAVALNFGERQALYHCERRY